MQAIWFSSFKIFLCIFLLGCLCFPSWFAGVGFLQVLDESFITYVYCNYLLSLCELPLHSNCVHLRKDCSHMIIKCLQWAHKELVLYIAWEQGREAAAENSVYFSQFPLTLFLLLFPCVFNFKTNEGSHELTVPNQLLAFLLYSYSKSTAVQGRLGCCHPGQSFYSTAHPLQDRTQHGSPAGSCRSQTPEWNTATPACNPTTQLPNV